ncbi:MAG: aldo/keto reductase [Pseudomonadota bacterium]
MERVTLADGLEFSRIAYGMWRLADGSDLSPAHVRAKIDLCLDQGITTMDQADIYGGYTAEAVFGEVLKADPSLRNRIEIVTKADIVAPSERHAHAPVKYYDTSRAHLHAAVEHSLTNMGIDHVDLFLVHRPDPFMDHNETGAALDELVQSGKVRFVGVSNFRPFDIRLLRAATKAPLITNQIEISLANIAAFTNGDLAFHRMRGERVMAWSPLGGGTLMTEDTPLTRVMDAVAADNGVDRAAIAVAFVLAHPAGLLPVVGTNNLDRIAKISEATTVQLDRPTWFRLYEAALGHEVP